MTPLTKRVLWVPLTVLAVFAALVPTVLITNAGATAPGGLEVSRAVYADQAGTRLPETASDLAAWPTHLRPVTRFPMTGGTNWVVLRLTNRGAESAWVFDPHGSLIDEVEARLFRPGRAPQTLVTGYRAPHEYLLHYGKDFALAPGERAVIVARVSTPFYASQPQFTVTARTAYQRSVSLENGLILGALGALLTLGAYNLFVYGVTRNRSFLYYSLYLFAYFLGWAFTFHVPSDLFGLRELRLHYVWFFLLPVLNTLFYLYFLRLREYAPRLARLSRLNLWLPLLLLPSTVFALPYAHLLATVVIGVWLGLALVCGVASWRAGFQPARFFVLGLMALILPASVILPGNLGLTQDVPFNSELATLLGGTLDALLLAFALAELIRLLTQRNERAITQLQQALHLAHTDGLTGLGNRYAFDLLFHDPAASPTLLVLIDLDGLKTTNDRFGHAAGDRVLQRFAAHLRELETCFGPDLRAFRLGGDEFVLLTHAAAPADLAAALRQIEARMQAGGDPQIGVSFGVASLTGAGPRKQSYEEADQRMYHHKQSKRMPGLRTT